MGIFGFLALGAGAVCGAWLRWWLAALFNPVFPTLPLGTLAANLLGGYLMGVVIEILGQYAVLAPEVRLAIATGFLGSLTTFSTFSAETFTLLSREEYLWTVVIVAAHVVGSVTLTALGVLTAKWLIVQGV